MASASTQGGGGGGGGARRVLSNRTDSTAPEDMKRRVFVGLKKLGHLGQYLDLLRQLFENFGPLDALSTFNGFAFMQFVNEKDAHSAIAALCGKEFYSCKMDVRLVTMRSNKDGDSDKSPLQLQDVVRDRSPIRRPDTTVNLQVPSVPVHKKKAPPPATGGGQSVRMDSDRLREELYLRYYAMLKKQARDTRVVDCIVIASNRSIADYAESVGHKVRNRGLYVDLMFLVSEASLPSALEEATRSGSAYAVVVSIQHQLHRSCTLNILQGTPEEHRNMPLLDALRLLQRHFESTRGLERERQDSELPLRAAEMADGALRGDPPTVASSASSARRTGGAGAGGGGGRGSGGAGNPPHVQPLLELLVDGKQLAPAELELLLDYVRDRRDSALRELCDRRGGGDGDGAFAYEPAKPPMGDELSSSRHYYRSSSPAGASKHHQQHHQHHQHHQQQQQQQQLPSPSSPSSSVLRYSLDGPGGTDGGGRAGLGLSMGGHGGGHGGHGGGHGGHGGHGGGLLGHQPGSGSDFGSPPMRRALGGGGSQFRY